MRRSEKNPLLFKNGNPAAPGLMEQLSFVYSCVKPFIWRAITVIAVILLIWAASCISPMLQQNLVDSFNNFDKRGVLIYGILTAVTLLIWRGGDTLWGLLASLLNVQMGAHLKKIFFRHLLKLPLGVIESGGAGYLGQRLHLDIEIVTSFICGGLLSLFLNFMKLCGAVVLLSSYDAGMMLSSAPVLLIFFILVWVFRRRQYNLSMRINEAAAEYRRNMQNSLDRMTLFKSRSGERLVDRRVNRNLERVTMLRLSRIRWERFYTLSLQIVPAVWFAMVWCYGALQVLDRAPDWTLGKLWAVSGYMLLIFMPGKMFFAGLLAKRNSDAALARLLELKTMLPEESNVKGKINKRASGGSVEFDNISFAYPGGKKVFNNFSLSLADGEHIGICGPSGGGKSTLGALLLRLYDVSMGEIRLNGKKLTDYSLNALRQSVGYIGQSTELFYASVRENLSHGGGYSDARIIDVLRRTGLGERLDENPGLLDLQIREDGSNFSAGERLKLALARELLRDTKVLVLDEATSMLDAESEKKVFELLRGEWKDRTVIFISHRDFASGTMDRIVKIGIKG